LCVKRCWERGINFFDTAEMYHNGESERELGVALKALGVPRKDYVLVTKVFFGGSGVNDMGCSRKHIIEGARAGLKRLDTPYVDVIYAHRPDFYTPLEEQVRAFNWLIDQGLALYWGTSEWPADMIEEACQIAERLGMHAPVTEQPQYNMLVRNRFEKEYKPLFEFRGLGTTIWGANCMGILTGKYNDGKTPAGSRREMAEGNPLFQPFFAPHMSEDVIAETLRKL
jgi:aryl-alcohol dehydrogenase-like predicted oxidoreductase